MVKLTINNETLDVENGITVLQACEIAGIEVPRFCYHERLSIAGNCRMCLVEMENSGKPVASCAMPVAEGMNIKTNSELVEKAGQAKEETSERSSPEKVEHGDCFSDKGPCRLNPRFSFILMSKKYLETR